MYLPCLSVQTAVRVYLSLSPPGVSFRMLGPRNLLIHLPSLRSPELDVVTPPLDGTILPGVTRASVLALLSHFPLTTALPQLPADMRIRTSERVLTLSELFAASAAGTLREVFCVGTAAVVIPAARIGWQRPRPGASAGTETEVVEIVLPPAGGPGSLAQVLWERLVDIQEGRVEWEGWGVPSL